MYCFIKRTGLLDVFSAPRNVMDYFFASCLFSEFKRRQKLVQKEKDMAEKKVTTVACYISAFSYFPYF